MAKTILLAEDSVTIQKVVEMTFAAEDFDIVVASSGQEAVKLALANPPDIVLADLSMEGENGYDVCSTLKSLDVHSEIPVLLLHGNAAKFDEARARAVGANGEITKPFESQALIDRVKILCGVPVSDGQAPAPPPAPPTRPPRPAPEATDEIAFDTSALSPATKPVRKTTQRQGPPPPPPPRKKGPPPPPRRKTEPGPGVEDREATFPLDATPRPTPPSPRVLVAAEPSITIEAEPPSGDEITEPLPSFDSPDIPSAPPRQPAMTVRGFIGGDLPPPPQGMPLPVAATSIPKAEPTPTPVPTPDVAEPTPVPTPDVAEPTPVPMPDVAEPTPVPTPDVAEPTPTPTPMAASPLGEMDAAMREAILKICREVIEKVVWEVVPDLAERIINEELDRLVAGNDE